MCCQQGSHHSVPLHTLLHTDTDRMSCMRSDDATWMRRALQPKGRVVPPRGQAAWWSIGDRWRPAFSSASWCPSTTPWPPMCPPSPLPSPTMLVRALHSQPRHISNRIERPAQPLHQMSDTTCLSSAVIMYLHDGQAALTKCLPLRAVPQSPAPSYTDYLLRNASCQQHTDDVVRRRCRLTEPRPCACRVGRRALPPPCGARPSVL